MAIKLGCIADDFTGATDLANNLVRAGMRVVQTINTPDLATAANTDADAVVIALKSRTIPATDAVAQSLEALRWLQAALAEQIYFKYCSTFDSTPAGNIGPVTEALMAALKTRLTIATPAFPDNGRTVFKGHLFVGDVLLSDSGMRHHPLTPMTDSNLVNVLAAQATVPVGLVDHRVVGAGPQAITRCFEELEREGVGIAIVDAISNDDLLRLGPALAGMPLVTGGSGVAIGLPANWGIEPSAAAAALPVPTGHRAIVSGSVSAATNSQVREFLASGRPAFAIDPLRVADGEDLVAAALAFADEHLADGSILVYSTESPEAVKRVQGALGAAEAGELVERTLASIAAGLVERGVRQLVVAGGETSGAVVQALGLQVLRIGAQIDPGVPWCAAPLPGGDTLHITLKSGNFGTPDFFLKALNALPQPV
jgi:3-dehydrotetronate 4-kinase